MTVHLRSGPSSPEVPTEGFTGTSVEPSPTCLPLLVFSLVFSSPLSSFLVLSPPPWSSRCTPPRVEGEEEGEGGGTDLEKDRQLTVTGPRTEKQEVKEWTSFSDVTGHIKVGS